LVYVLQQYEELCCPRRITGETANRFVAPRDSGLDSKTTSEKFSRRETSDEGREPSKLKDFYTKLSQGL